MYNQLINNLTELKLFKTKELLEYYSKAVTNGEKTFTEALDEIMVQEMKLREERAMGACVKTAYFPYLKQRMTSIMTSSHRSINCRSGNC